ncbi:MAG TPA: histone-like protein [Bdellovibrionota bacterium]|nr:histone-like protein [Bdellovibrionota bacterium]
MEETNENPGTPSKEVLVVASKVKNYIKTSSGLNTSSAVMEVLSDKVRQLCNEAIERAKQDGRKTVMDRDFGVETQQ